MNDDWIHQLGVTMCEQWGIDPKQCHSITIHWAVDKLPIATVELLMNEGLVRELLTLAPIDRVRLVDEEPA